MAAGIFHKLLCLVLLVVYLDTTCASGGDNHDEHERLEKERAEIFSRVLFEKYGTNDSLSFEGFEHLVENLGIGNVAIKDSLRDHFKDGTFTAIHVSHKHGAEDHDHDHNGSSGDTGAHGHSGGKETHQHTYEMGHGRRKRHEGEHDEEHMGSNLTEEEDQILNQCLSPEKLLTLYGVRADEQISVETFMYLCPALIVQIDQHKCYTGDEGEGHEGCHGHEDEGAAQVDKSTMTAKRWLYPIVSVILVSLVGVLCVGVVPLLKKHVFVHLLHFLVALAVGSLTGDALLHLLPHALAPLTHNHDAGGHDEDSDGDLHSAAVWKGMATLFGLFTFFLFERVLGILTDYRNQNDQRKAVMEDTLKQHLENIVSVTHSGEITEERRPKFGRSTSQRSAGGKRPSRVKRSSISFYLNENEVVGEDDDQFVVPRGVRSFKSTTISEAPVEEDEELEELNDNKVAETRLDVANGENVFLPIEHLDDSADEGHGHSHAAGGSLSAMACMVIMGDGLHNLCDGLAIGAAFASSITAGLSTTVAVLCHELPHELGDFAVLLKDGMPTRRALFFNVVSSILCFLGMVIGVFVGHLGSVSDWIFCAVAGMFIYISLADMLPQLNDKDAVELLEKMRNLLLQILGLAAGIIIMLVIALYEDKIVVSLGS